jgi:hypothetical protein
MSKKSILLEVPPGFTDNEDGEGLTLSKSRSSGDAQRFARYV